jgi:hypothetical protein
MKRKYLQIIISIFLITLSLFYAFKGVSLKEMGDAFLSVHYLYLIPTILLVAISYLLRAMRWRYLIRSVKDVKTINLFSPLMIGFMGNMLPARAGEFIRAYLLSKKERISFSTSFATVFIERVFDLVLLLFLLAWVLFFMPEVFTGSNNQLIDKIKYFGEISLLLCLFIFLFSALLQFKNDLAIRIVKFFIKPFPDNWKVKTLQLVNSFSDGLKIIRDKRGFIIAILFSFLIWGTFILTYYPLYIAFDIEDKLPVVSSLIVLCLTVAVFITLMPTPGFLGSYQLACVAALHGIFGIHKSVALSYSIVAWVIGMGFTVIVGALFAIKENISLGEMIVSKNK